MALKLFPMQDGRDMDNTNQTNGRAERPKGHVVLDDDNDDDDDEMGS